jgi:hypothetical protein
MKRHSYVVAVILGCFLGTAISNLIIIPRAAKGTAAPKPKIIRANRFELVDNDGAKRASLEMEDKDKTAALYLWDSKENPLVVLKASANGSSLLMKIENKPAFGFAVDKKMGVMGTATDVTTGKPGIDFRVSERGAYIFIYEGDRPRAVQTIK